MKLKDWLQLIRGLYYSYWVAGYTTTKVKQLSFNIIGRINNYFSGLKAIKKRYLSRIYYGSEFCENLIPDTDEMKKIVVFCKSDEINLTFMTPYCTAEGIEKLRKVFLILPDMTEIVFNDFGVFCEIKKMRGKSFKPILGRLLLKYKRDPRVTFLGKRDALLDYFRSSNLNIKEFQEFLIENMILRVEIENSLQGYNFKLDKIIRASLYLPYVYMTNTNKCLFKDGLNSPRCGLECKDYIVLSRINGLSTRIITQGNTEFYKNSKIPDKGNLKRLNVDRIVYFPEIPRY